MKITNTTIGWGIATFVWCLFMGVTAISIGIGAAFPPANLIAKPFVCPNGNMTFEQVVSKPLPGTTYTLTSWYCVDDRSGAKTELDIFPMSLYAGLIYGLLLFVVVAIIGVSVQRRALASAGSDRASPPTGTAHMSAARHGSPPMDLPEAAGGAMARMTELEKLRAANMISEAEYQQKRAEILRKL